MTCALSLADSAAYTEGTVTQVFYMRTKPGMFAKYMKWLGQARKTEEALMKAGVILSYRVFAAKPKTPQEPDVILMVEYQNMAALDNLDEKVDAMDQKVQGSAQGSPMNTVDPQSLREVLGSELIRELKLK